MAAGSIVIDLLMRTGSFVTDTKRAEKSLEQLKKEAYQTGLQIGDSFKSIAALGGVTLSIGGIVAAVDTAIKGAAAFQDLSEVTGAAAVDLAALSVAAATAGVPMEAIGSSINKLTKNLVGVDDESKEAGAALKALGIEVEAFKKLDPASQYEEIGKALANFSDEGTSGAAKVAIVTSLFGKAGAEQLKVFKALEEQGGRTTILTKKMIADADAFYDQIGQTTQQIKLYAAANATSLLPALSAVKDELFGVKQNGEGVSIVFDVLKTTLESLAVFGFNVAYTFKNIGREFGAIVAQASAFWRLDFSQITVIRDAVRGDAAAASKELDALERRILGVGKELTGKRLTAFDDPRSLTFGKDPKPQLGFRGVGGAKGGGRVGGEKISDAQRELASYVKSLDGQITKLDELTELQKALNFLQTLGTTGQIPQVRELVLGLAQQADAMRDIKAQEEDIIALRKLEVAATRDLDEEIDRISGNAADRRKAALTNRLEQNIKAGIKYSPEQLEKMVKDIAGISTEAEKSKTIAEELGMSFTSAFEDAIVGGRGLRDVLKGLEQDILRIITRKLVTEPLGDAITGILKGSGGGFLSSIGNFMSGLFGGRAFGGPVNAGGMYEVNERGRPEMLQMDGREFLLMGNRRGWVDPNPRAGGGSTTWAPVFNMSFAPGTSAATATQAGAMVARRIQAAAARNG